MSSAESCSYIGIISYFSYEVRHSFMGDRLVTLEGKTVKKWNDEMLAHPIMSVVMYATGDSVVAGLVPATSRRCCGRVFICEISVSASAFFSSYGFHTDSSGAASPKSA